MKIVGGKGGWGEDNQKLKSRTVQCNAYGIAFINAIIDIWVYIVIEFWVFFFNCIICNYV